MKSFINFAVLPFVLLVVTPVWAGLFSSCNYGSAEPRPEWVRNMEFNLPGFYYGIGSSAQDGKGEYQQKLASENDAKRNLSEQIEVKIKSLNEQSTRISDQSVHKEALSSVVVSTDEILRGLKIGGQWVDKETCKYFTLMVVSKDAVIQAKQEKLMRNRLEQFKKYLAEGLNAEKNRDIEVRKTYLEIAQVTLADTDFVFLKDEFKKNVYENQLKHALDILSRDSSKVEGRMALFAINKDGRINNNQVGKLLDKLRSGDNTLDHLMSNCNNDEECISRAKERGFSKLTMLSVSTKIVSTHSGTIQGTLSLSKLVYDIESRKVLAGPENFSTGVIGWSADDLDWNSAVEAAIKRIK